MYNKFTKNNIKVDFNRSHNNWVYDLNTNELYLDLHNSYSSMPLGYSQIESSNILMKNLSICEYSSLLHESLFQDFEHKMLTDKYDAYHLAPSGGVAVEMALKVALKATGGKEFISLHGSFHGVTGMSAEVTSDEFADRISFSPRYRKIEIPVNISKKSIKNYIYKKCEKYHLFNNPSLIIVESIQCSYGDRYLDWEYLKALREIAREREIPFIVDEIQTGFYATGKKWYSEELEPDIIIFGKKTQVSGILTSGKYSKALEEIYNLISITHDADLADLARFKIVSDYVEQNELLDFSERFLSLKNKKFKDIRAMGFLWAIEFDNEKKCKDFCEFLFKNKIIVNKTGSNIVRLRPSFVFSEEDMSFLENVIKNYSNS